MNVDTTRSQQQNTPATTERVMLDAVRRRLIEIHYGLADATAEDREAKAWAQRELKALIHELTPYRQSAGTSPESG
jgi:hypothetical protein